MNIEGLSLDQMRVALAVASAGSFSAAARQFRRAQSAVSYAITTLETQLGTALFERGSQRARPTPQGVALLAEMAAILSRADALKHHARAVASGQEPSLRLIVDSLYDLGMLARVARRFAEIFPASSLAIEVESMQRVLDAVASGRAQLALLASLSSVPPGLRSRDLPAIDLVPVASADHPITRERELTDDVQQAHVQIVLGERGETPPELSYFVFAARTWRVTDLEVKHALLLSGAGWGYMPHARVAADLSAGRLVCLGLDGMPRVNPQPVFLVWAPRTEPGPCTEWLIEAFTTLPPSSHSMASIETSPLPGGNRPE